MAAAISPVALVTGGSRGIGRAIVRQLAERGWSVAVNFHRKETAARETLAALPGQNHALFRRISPTPRPAPSSWRPCTNSTAASTPW